MQHTLIAVFDNRADAEHAMDELLASGFSRQDVKISKGDPTGITDSVTGRSGSAAGDAHEDEGFGASIRHFFSDIFGTDNSTHAQKYSDAVSRGHHVLTLTTESEPEVERAADIVERHGPVDIDEKHAEWAGGAPVANPESMRMSGAGGLQQSAGLSQQSASMSQDLGEDRNLYQQQSLNTAEPMGTTYQEPQGGSLQGSSLEGSAMQGGSLSGSQRDLGQSASLSGSSLTGSAPGGSQQRDTSLQGSSLTGVQRGSVRIFSQRPGMSDDDYYRQHWNSSLGSSGRYEDYQPAYSYGTEMARSEQYRGRKWDDVESALHHGWDSRYGMRGDAKMTWEKMKAAVRHGWDRLTGDADSDSAYRSHWDSNYSSLGGSYDDYAPAYRYGSDMAGSDKYRGRKWDDVESHLRSDWDSRYGSSERSAWEKTKDAVRHGWNKMTGDTDSDDYYRSHWSSNYSSLGGSYDDYAPAYRYGAEMRNDSRYRNRQWDDVESELRSDWDTRYGSSGASTWEKMKAAIRHGWDRMTS